MELDKFEENGVQYVQLYASCPTCREEGRSKPNTLYSHHACGGDMYIGDNATIKCKKCGVSHHINKWQFGCQQCNNLSDGVLYERKDEATMSLAEAMSISGMMVTECGFLWLSRFMANIESGWGEKQLQDQEFQEEQPKEKQPQEQQSNEEPEK